MNDDVNISIELIAMKNNNSHNHLDKYAIQVNYCSSDIVNPTNSKSNKLINKDHHIVSKQSHPHKKSSHVTNKIKINKPKQYYEDNDINNESPNQDYYDEFLQSIQIKKTSSNHLINNKHKHLHIDNVNSPKHSTNSSTSNIAKPQEGFCPVGKKFKNIKKISVADVKKINKTPSLGKDDKDKRSKLNLNLIENTKGEDNPNEVLNKKELINANIIRKKRQSKEIPIQSVLERPPSHDNIKFGFTPKKRIKIQTDELMIMQNQGKTEESKQKGNDPSKSKHTPFHSTEIKEETNNKKKYYLCCIPRK